MRRLVTVAGSMVACLFAAWYGACGGSGDDTSGAAASGNSAAAGTGGAGTGATGLGGLAFGGQTAAGGIEGCNPQTFTLDKGPPPEIYLVIDSSGSMTSTGSGTATKWEELVTAVGAALAQYESAIEFGALVYPIDQVCAAPAQPQVAPPALDARTAILAALSIVPNGGTPTASAIEAAATSLLAVGDPDEPDFLVLATDGGPNCSDALSVPCTCGTGAGDYCCSNPVGESCVSPLQCLDDQHTLDVIASYHNQGIDTFVIGLPGTSSYEDLLNEMAVAGGRPQQGGATQYYNATSPAEIAAALQDIASQTITCTIQLTEAPTNPDAVFIFLDGTAIPRDPEKQNGWEYTDDTQLTIELYGSYCETIQNGAEHTVTATFQCEVR